jgi:beta-lactamase superfamily II metal-dependent hydrolase
VHRLRALGVDSLDLVIASHNHTDPIGGASEVLRQSPVRFYLARFPPLPLYVLLVLPPRPGH